MRQSVSGRPKPGKKVISAPNLGQLKAKKRPGGDPRPRSRLEPGVGTRLEGNQSED